MAILPAHVLSSAAGVGSGQNEGGASERIMRSSCVWVWGSLFLGQFACNEDERCPCAGSAHLIIRSMDAERRALPPDRVEVSMSGQPATEADCVGARCEWDFYGWPEGLVTFQIRAIWGQQSATTELSVDSDELWIESGCDCGGWAEIVEVTFPEPSPARR